MKPTSVLLPAAFIAVALSLALSSSAKGQRRDDLHGLPAAGAQEPKAKSNDTSSRTEQFKSLESEYRKAYDEYMQTLRSAKTKEEREAASGKAPWERFAPKVRQLIEADPKDEIALDAILFSLTDLWQTDPKLYTFLATYHITSPKLGKLVYPFAYQRANEKFLRTLI